MIHDKHLKEEDHLEYTPKTAVPMMGKEQQVGEYYQNLKSSVERGGSKESDLLEVASWGRWSSSVSVSNSIWDARIARLCFFSMCMLKVLFCHSTFPFVPVGPL